MDICCGHGSTIDIWWRCGSAVDRLSVVYVALT